MTQSFKNLGSGLGFRPCHYQEILATRPSAIAWLEVISENFMNIGGRPREVLETARTTYPIALHGVGLSIGSPEPISQKYLQDLKDLTSWVNPCLISDHLCFTSHGRHNSHDLLPIPYTKLLLERISDRLKLIQDFLGRRFMLENPSAYVSYAKNDMTEQEFLARLVENTGCGILLDLNNLYVNQMNLGTDPLNYLSTIPEAAVGQIHLAGHSIEETAQGTVRIDTHDHAVREEVWSLYQIAKGKWPEASTMVEWDDHIPQLSELLPLLERIESTSPATIIMNSSHSAVNALPSAGFDSTPVSLSTLFAMAIDSNGLHAEDTRLHVLADEIPVPRLLGMQVYNNAYFARLRDTLHDEFPTLAAVTTDDGFTAIAADYLQKHPSSEPSVNRLGRHLSQHLKNTTIENFDFGVSLIALSDIASLDDTRSATFIHSAREHVLPLSALGELSPDQWEQVRFEWNPTLSVLQTTFDIAPLWAAINSVENETEPTPPSQQATSIRVWRHQNLVHHEVMNDQEASLLACMQGGTSFAAAAQQTAESSKITLEESTTFAITTLAKWTGQGLVAGIII